ncbi:MAG: LacI family DNA-binding transcriptional regulator, partial [Pseudomonadota bacterium]
MLKRRTTLKDVADALEVHSSTVSRALDPRTRHLITSELADRIMRTARELGYQPNAQASSLRTRRSMTVGVVVPDITNVVFPPILRGIEDRLSQSGYITMIVNTDGNPERESTVIDTLRSRGVDGLILASAQREDPAISRAVAEGIPIVTVNRMVNDPNVSSVSNDDSMGITFAIDHMMALGHRRIAHIAGPLALSTGIVRHDAFKRVKAERYLDDNPLMIAQSRAFTEAEGERCAKVLLERNIAFTAIVCANDQLALGTIRALRSAGLSCPDRISVSGYNDMPLVDRLDPPLTTVRIQQRTAGARAAEILLAQMEEEGRARLVHIELPVELVVRGSTA